MRIDEALAEVKNPHRAQSFGAREPVLTMAAAKCLADEVERLAAELKDLGQLTASMCQNYRSAVSSLQQLDEQREELHGIAGKHLPSLADIHAMHLGIPDGMDSAEYVRRIRCGEPLSPQEAADEHR